MPTLESNLATANLDNEGIFIWEFYVPKRASYVTRLYGFLRDALTPVLERRTDELLPPMRLDGYSVYEVDGAYSGV